MGGIMATANSGSYPIKVKLRDGREATVRIMEPSDRDAILKFAAKLPGDDLLFLRTDITDKEVIKGWVDNVKSGNTVTLLAEIDGDLAAYASVHVDSARWTRRVGEIRVLASPRARGLGLGRRLTNEIFQVAKSLGLKKLTAQMTPDQTSARSAFERLGFQVEAILTDWVEDRTGHPRDLLIMTHDVTGFSDHIHA
jgi:ribosomal protein S18 acetylase RimI-like enzyme